MLSMVWIFGALALLPAFLGDSDPAPGQDEDNPDDDTDPVVDPNPDDGNGDPDPGATGTVGADLLTGTEDDDVLSGWADSYEMNDIFGNDTLYGGGGDDSLSGPNGDDQLYGGPGHDTLEGFDGDDTLAGGTDDDRLDGFVGNDLLQGDTGNDLLLSRDGGDTMDGGQGDDSLFAGGAQSALNGGAGDDYLNFGGGVTLSGGAGADRLDYVGAIWGDADASRISTITDFDPAQDQLSVTLSASLGAGYVTPLSLVDWADGQGADLVFGDQVLIRIAGAQGMDPATILADVTIDHSAAGAEYHDGNQSSTIHGGPSPDQIFGGGGNDSIDVSFQDGQEAQDDEGDLAEGGIGDDTLIGQGGDAYYDRDDSDDTQGHDVVLIHEDSLIGGDGDDLLRGTNGSLMTGGAGADQFEVILDTRGLPDGQSYPPARITDFDPATDSLSVQAIGVEDAGALSVAVWADGLGSDILLGQTVVARVTGGQGLTVADLAPT